MHKPPGHPSTRRTHPDIELPPSRPSTRMLPAQAAIKPTTQSPRRYTHGGFWLTAMTSLSIALACPPPARAAVSILQPPREASTQQPLEVTLMYSGDPQMPLDFDVPAQLTVTLTNGDVPPKPVILTREADAPAHLSLPAGQFHAVRFSAPWPDWARGILKMDVVGFDVSPVLIALTRNGSATTSHEMAAAQDDQPSAAVQTAQATGQATGQAAVQAAAQQAYAAPNNTRPVPDNASLLTGRFSLFEPIYFADGSNGRNLARFQLSLKYRLVIPDDPRSRGLVDNLYFGYTQMSLWDIRAHSSPFHDTSYMPQVFYYVPDTGWTSPIFKQMSMMAGIGHESNGRDGDESRSIDILFVRPSWDIGDPQANHLTISPKVYYYLPSRKEDNPDIADYRGYVDLLIKYGSPESWQLATTLRKGTKSWYGSIDTQLTYPLARLFSNAWGGYIWVGYFNGYGESLLEYNQKHWIARIGLSLAR